MVGKRMNVLVYAGSGSTVESVRHTTWSLRRLLGPNYAIITVTGDQILKEPWTSSCALLVMPGGADLGYCRTLNGEGNRRIKQYVQLGGAYLGLCAGGYYGCEKCEFEVDKKSMEVVGERELGFFPGVCRGLAFEGFRYHSEAGTRAAKLEVNREALAAGGGTVPERLRSYYNGGGVFVDAGKLRSRGVEVLARFVEDLAVEAGEDKAAVVYCKVGEGAAVLTSPHPEFSGLNLNRGESTGSSDYPKIVDALVANEKQRTDFMKACLTKLGLQVSQESDSVPSLSQLHLSSAQPSQITELLEAWQGAGIITKEDNREVIKGENDTFIIEPQGDSRWNIDSLAEAVEEDTLSPTPGSQQPISTDAITDYNSIPKHIVPHSTSLPEGKQTPYFNHHAFYANLRPFHSLHRDSPATFGQHLLYGEVVTSTSTLLEKNPKLLAHLPTGLTATATTQVAGRGRGTNVWVSPPGSLMFSTVMRHSLQLSQTAPVVFVQYLAALAIVAGIQGYDRGYDKLPIKLKWPNDIYALDPSRPASEEKHYVKIGGILVNSSYAGGDYTLVCGIGLNVSNPSPTTSLSHLASKLNLPPPTLEKLLASILAQFEALYTRFTRTGFDKHFEELYYKDWLHSGQIVTLENEGSVRARIKGITTDWGLLVAEELGWEDRGTGKRWALQSDSNSFDFFRGLVKRKV